MSLEGLFYHAPNYRTALRLHNLYVHPAVHLAQGGHECYNIATGKIINRCCETNAPITAAIIAAVCSCRQDGQATF